MLQLLSKLRQRAEDEKGFTLIELLVVVLIIGILAAIALPTFLGQRSKAQDAGAKSAARNTVSHVESCYANSQDYTACDNAGLTTNEQVPAGDLTASWSPRTPRTLRDRGDVQVGQHVHDHEGPGDGRGDARVPPWQGRVPEQR